MTAKRQADPGQPLAGDKELDRLPVAIGIGTYVTAHASKKRHVNHLQERAQGFRAYGCHSKALPIVSEAYIFEGRRHLLCKIRMVAHFRTQSMANIR